MNHTMTMNDTATTMSMDHGGHAMTTMSGHGNHAMTTMDHGSHGSHGSGHSSMGHGTIHFGYQETIVFSGWTTTNEGTFVVTCLALFAIAFIFESVKFIRDVLIKRKYLNKLKSKLKKKSSDMYNINDEKSGSDEVLKAVSETETEKEPYYKKIFNGLHYVQTVLYFIQVTLAYFLMLAFMTYNFWICLSILLGLATGFFFFGYERSMYSVDDETCH